MQCWPHLSGRATRSAGHRGRAAMRLGGCVALIAVLVGLPTAGGRAAHAAGAAKAKRRVTPTTRRSTTTTTAKPRRPPTTTRAASTTRAGTTVGAPGSTVTGARPSPQTFLVGFATDPRMARLPIGITLPPTWKVSLDAEGTLGFVVDGWDAPVFGAVGLPLDGTNTERIAKAIRLQYGDGAGLERTVAVDARTWAQRVEGEYTHARYFIPVDGGVMMAFVLLRNATPAQVREVRTAFESIRIAVA